MLYSNRVNNLIEISHNSYGHGFKIGSMIVNFGIKTDCNAGDEILFPIKFKTRPVIQVGCETATDYSSAINTNPNIISLDKFIIAHNYSSNRITVHWLAIGY